MSGATISALVLAAIAILGAIGSVLMLAFRIGTLVGTNTAFMAASERDRAGLRSDLARQTDRLSLHIEHHGTAP